MRVSNYDYPEDEFDVGEDDGPVPVGVHRAQVPRWRSWVPLLAILIIVPALAWGAVTLFLNGSGGGSSDAVSSTQPAQSGQAGKNQASGGKTAEASKPADSRDLRERGAGQVNGLLRLPGEPPRGRGGRQEAGDHERGGER